MPTSYRVKVLVMCRMPAGSRFWVRIAAFAALVLAGACATRPKEAFEADRAPTPPNYSSVEAWAATPFTVDPADRTPGTFTDEQSVAEADIFFLHTTSYTGKRRGDKNWNGSVYDPGLRERTDDVSILYQASLFNGAGRVFAPRYRQAHLHAYDPGGPGESARQALELAYSDVKAAFEYYLKNYNHGRPIIVAAHHQGTTHARRLISEFFDGKPLQEQLVVAYLVGIPVEADAFDFIKACGGPNELNCFCSWRTWREGRFPPWYVPGNDIAVTNPLTWTTMDALAPSSLNEGGVLRNPEKVVPGVTSAQVSEGVLWARKPKFPWGFFRFSSNYEAEDYNLYYANVRRNAMQRVAAFVKLRGDREENTGD